MDVIEAVTNANSLNNTRSPALISWPPGSTHVTPTLAHHLDALATEVAHGKRERRTARGRRGPGHRAS